MNRKQLILLCMVLGMTVFELTAQNHMYYVQATDVNFDPPLVEQGGVLRYTGKDRNLKDLFDNINIYVFTKAFTASKQDHLLRVFIVESDITTLQQEFINYNVTFYDSVDYLGIDEFELTEDCVPTYPDDYGTTGPTGGSIDNHAYDFIGLPCAWYYTTGTNDIDVGVADGGPLVITDAEFSGKSVSLPNDFGINNMPIHGNSASAIATAKGDNNNSSTGVCYDCSLIKNGYRRIDNDIRYNRVLELSYAGSRIINLSWQITTFPRPYEQDIIDEVTANGSIVVASSGNKNWNPNTVDDVIYPGAYDGVISVGSVGSRNENPTDDMFQNPDNNNQWTSKNVQNHVGGTIVFWPNPPSQMPDPTTHYTIAHNSTNVMNDFVDIMAPSLGVFRYGAVLFPNGGPNGEPTDLYGKVFATSRAAPMVSGTIGLMKSLNECMTLNEVESVLKIASTNIDHIQANQTYAGKYGSGSLHAGRAVELTHHLMNYNETAYLEGQKFTRWDFEFNGVCENIIMQDQEFTQGATVEVLGKQAITLDPGTLLEPNSDGYALFEIDSSYEIETNCPMTINSLGEGNSKKNETQILYGVYPTLVTNEINLVNKVSEEVLITTVKIYDMFNQEVFTEEQITNSEVLLKVDKLLSGIYILKGYNAAEEEIITTKFIKR